jgi:hypothetical protein
MQNQSNKPNDKPNEMPANTMCAGSGLDIIDVLHNHYMQLHKEMNQKDAPKAIQGEEKTERVTFIIQSKL